MLVTGKFDFGRIARCADIWQNFRRTVCLEGATGTVKLQLVPLWRRPRLERTKLKLRVVA